MRKSKIFSTQLLLLILVSCFAVSSVLASDPWREDIDPLQLGLKTDNNSPGPGGKSRDSGTFETITSSSYTYQQMILEAAYRIFEFFGDERDTEPRSAVRSPRNK